MQNEKGKEENNDHRLRFSSNRAVPLVRQAEVTECGLACLAMIGEFHGRPVDLPMLRRHFPTSLSGVTLKRLMEIADRLGFVTRALRFELEDLSRLKLPAVLHWDMKHFVVLVEVGTEHIVVHDPAQGRRRLSIVEASRYITGVALELEPARDFTALSEKEAHRLRLRDFWTGSRGLGRTIFQLALLSIILQVFILATPFYLQITIDEALRHHDVDLLLVLFLGFGLLYLINFVTDLLRRLLQLFVGNTLIYQLVANLMNHLMRLPVRWFQQRHTGDVVSRIESTRPIQTLFEQGLIASIADGLMAVTTLVVMFIYSWELALIGLAVFSIFVAVRLVLLRSYRQRLEEKIIADAREMTLRLENIRGIQAIKLFGRESERKNAWANAQAEAINANVRVGKFDVAFESVGMFFDSARTLVIVFAGALMIVDGGFTVGMLIAFLAYLRNFSRATDSFISEMFQLAMTRLHLDRISDIVCSEPEVDNSRGTGLEPEIQGHLRLDDVAFRYGSEHPLLFSRVNLDVQPGEAVAISGESGTGKTTLLRLMLGLQSPTSGQVIFDDLPLQNLSLDSFRQQTAVVMQDDQLLSGSVLENITFFDPQPDIPWAHECAHAAVLHEDILAMPMKYHSLIGDMGTVLSGGQKQRLLLARALYHRPRILFVDEGTSHLDPVTEQRVTRNLREMNITRIQIAHRLETIRNADRIFELRDGCLAEISSEQFLTHRESGRERPEEVAMGT